MSVRIKLYKYHLTEEKKRLSWCIWQDALSTILYQEVNHAEVRGMPQGIEDMEKFFEEAQH